MKALIVYSSQSGNTKKLAQAIKDSLAIETRLLPVEQAPLPQPDEIAFVGFWLRAGKPDPETADYLAKMGDARLFLFATHGAAADSRHAQDALAHARALATSATILGTFNCQGQVNPKALEKARAKTPKPAWVDDADTALGHPDETDIANLEKAVQALNLAP